MPAPVDRVAFYKKVIVATLILAVVLILFRTYAGYRSAQQLTPPLPFGVEADATDGSLMFRDFPILMTFCQQIWNGDVERPYSLAGQEAFFRHWLPQATRGLNVSYAPTVLLWAWPLNFVSPPVGFLLMSLLNAAVLFLLARFYLFPRVANLPHLLLIGLGLLNISLFSCLGAAHNPILTAGLLALTWTWLRGRLESAPLEWWKEALLTLILFGLSAKPHLAVMLGALLLAARLWRPVVAATVVFAASAYILSPWLGGWPTWLKDYLSLVGGHTQAELGTFLYFGPEQSSNFSSFIAQLFPQSGLIQLAPLLWAGGLCTLLLLRWMGRLSLAYYFYASYALFFLFSPSLAPSEDWVMVLFVAEIPFFQQTESWKLWTATAVLLFVALNLKQFPGTGLASLPLLFPAKFLLATLATVWMARRRT